MKVLVLGASGLMGANLVPALQRAGHEVVRHGRTSSPGSVAADLAEPAAVTQLFEQVRPQATLNLAGLTDVDQCEARPQQAWRANVWSVEQVAAASWQTGSHLIHISTDQVYDAASPSTEDQACPGNHYAMTKYAGELAARATGATILRTNFFGAGRHPTRRSLTDWLHGVLTRQEAIRVFEDVRFSPLSLTTLCSVMAELLALRPPGVYNLGSREGLSKADFAFAFARHLGLPQDRMTRASVGSAALGAWRPKDMRMDCTRMETVLGRALPTLEAEIELAAKDYRAYF